MKKLFNACALSALATGSLAAQGIYNVSPNDGVTESIPLEITTTLNFGYDDNITPTVKVNRGDDSSYTSFNVAANYLDIGPQTHIDFNLKLGVLHYLDNIENSNVKDTYSDSRGQLNISHNISERLRVSTRNYLFYGLEPDYNYGVVNDRSNDEYLYFSTDNAVGYKWTERLGTYTGFKFDTLNYDSADSRNDRQNVTLYNQFRYVLNQTAVGTLDYRYNQTDVKGGLDSNSHKLLAGVEYRLNRTAVLIAKAGIQHRSVDTRDSQNDPTFELSYLQRVNEAFRVRSSLAYDVNDYGTSFFGSNFENNQTLRFSVAGDYHFSSRFFMTSGINYVANEYYGGRPTDEVDVLNFSIGGTFELMHNLAANLNYNYTNSNDDGDTLSRDYSRNRIQAGLTYTF